MSDVSGVGGAGGVNGPQSNQQKKNQVGDQLKKLEKSVAEMKKHGAELGKILSQLPKAEAAGFVQPFADAVQANQDAAEAMGNLIAAYQAIQ